jgi:hypothetical protein
VPATILIAIGAFIPTITDSLNRFGSTELFHLGKFLGVVFLFAGFLVSIEVFREIRVPFTGIRLPRAAANRAPAAEAAEAADAAPARAVPPATEAASEALRPPVSLATSADAAPYHDRVTPSAARFPGSPSSLPRHRCSGPSAGFPVCVRRRDGAARVRGWRALIGAITTGLFVAWRVRRGDELMVRWSGLASRERLLLGIAAVTGFTLNFAMFIAFDLVTIALALLVFYTYPAMVAVVAVALGRERLDRSKLAALGLALAGMVRSSRASSTPPRGSSSTGSASCSH